VGTVVGGVHDDGVFGYPQLVEEIEQLTDLTVMIDHGVVVLALAGDTPDLVLDPGPQVHLGGVPSNPCTVGRKALRSPKWFFPNYPVR
jgi:hypothetical protein